MPVEIEIYSSGFKTHDTKLKYIDQTLPKPAFRWIINGPTMCGKSTLIKNVIFNKK